MRDTLAFYKKLGENIRGARKAIGKSQDEIGTAIGMQRSSISNIEKGRQKLLLHTFSELADVLGIEPTKLLPKKAESLALAAKAEKILATLPDEERAFVELGVGFLKQGKTKRK